MSVSNARMRRGRTLLVRNEVRLLIELDFIGFFRALFFSFHHVYLIASGFSCLDSFYISGVGVGSRMGFFMYVDIP
jgi:hypothetical protein